MRRRRVGRRAGVWGRRDGEEALGGGGGTGTFVC